MSTSPHAPTPEEIEEQKALGVTEFLAALTERIAHPDEESPGGMGLCPTHMISAIAYEIGEVSLNVTDQEDMDAYLRGAADFYNFMMASAAEAFHKVALAQSLREIGVHRIVPTPDLPPS